MARSREAGRDHARLIAGEEAPMSARVSMSGQDPFQDASKLLDIIGASWMSQAVYVAAELRLTDLLAGGPRRVAELAKAAGCQEESLGRLMRGLASLGVC